MTMENEHVVENQPGLSPASTFAHEFSTAKQAVVPDGDPLQLERMSSPITKHSHTSNWQPKLKWPAVYELLTDVSSIENHSHIGAQQSKSSHAEYPQTTALSAT